MLIQKLLLAKGESNVFPIDFYFNSNIREQISTLDERSLNIPKGESVLFNTYYNIFSVLKWKNFTAINDLSLILKGTGRVRITCFFIDINTVPQCIYEADIELSSEGVQAPIEKYKELKTGAIYIKIAALTDCELYDNSGFMTNTPAPNDHLKLGLVITHYNRKQHILPVLKKLSQEISEDTLLSQHASIVVVDNSSNIEKNEIQGISYLNVIPNANLGGSGGYARGLLYLKDHNFSHCLYTDDDVAFEPESIRRCLAFLVFGNDKTLSVVGSIFSEEQPYRCLQTGAKFNYRGWIGLNNGVNFADMYQIVAVDHSLSRPDYGAWPFFAFPIHEVSHFPFPYFVRGDDVLFGIQNNFNIVSLNGIGVTVGNIIHREGPMSLYQDTRAILSINCFKNTSKILFIKIFTSLFISQLLSYKYGSVNSVLKAFEDVWSGPEFFAKNVDCLSIRKEVKTYAEKEAFTNIDTNEPDYVSFTIHESLIRRLIRYLTINGVLLPNCLLKNQSVYQLKSFKAVFRQIFLYKKVFYYCPYTRRFLLVEMDKKIIFVNILKYLKCLFKILTQYGKVKKLYHKNSTKVGSEDFWRIVYKDSF